MSGKSHNKHTKVTGGGKFTPEQREEYLDSLREGRGDNSGGFYVPPVVESSRVSSVSSTAESTSTEPAHVVYEDNPITSEASTLAIRAIRSGVDPSRVLIPRTTLENAVVNDIGDVLPPDDSGDDEVLDDDFSYYEDDYRVLTGQEPGHDNPGLGGNGTSVGISSAETILPEGIGLVGAVQEVDGDVVVPEEYLLDSNSSGDSRAA